MDMLDKARQYEILQGNKISEEERPVFHITPMGGWLNDPNGLSYYNGKYHVFYQYHPYATHWGPMHWGHVISEDMLHWERVSLAMAPDQEYDKAGCFSGSALVEEDGSHYIIYTGVSEKINEQGEKITYQTQCIAFGDGENYTKYENNPVITGDMIPKGWSKEDFRDPKVWKHGEDWYVVVANKTEDGSGAILLFTSKDGIKWSFSNVIDCSRNEYGKMWECPDFFLLEDRAVLIVSPMKMAPIKRDFPIGHCTIFLTGTFDYVTKDFKRENVKVIDYGLDFYAPQTLLAPDGRRIMIGWMQGWASSNCQLEDSKYFGQLTLPRELYWKDGNLMQSPIREMEAYRKDGVIYKDVTITGKTTLPKITGRVVDIIVKVRPDNKGMYHNFTMHIAHNDKYDTKIIYNPAANTLEFDRENSGFNFRIIHASKMDVSDYNGEITLRLIMDRFSVELFVNEGEQVMTSTLYTPKEADGILFEVIGNAIIDIEKYELKK